MAGERAKSGEKMYFRKAGLYSIDEVLSKVLIGPEHEFNVVSFDGEWVKMGSIRYQNFKIHGVQCYFCGIQGKYFVMEKHQEKHPYHFNLYAIDDNGDEVLMTKDHIFPKSGGGKNELNNFQPLCHPCNMKKKDQGRYYDI